MTPIDIFALIVAYLLFASGVGHFLRNYSGLRDD